MFFRVGKILFGKEKLGELPNLIKFITPVANPKTIVIMDEIHQQTGLYEKVKALLGGFPLEFIFIKLTSDPGTEEVDKQRDYITRHIFSPDLLIGIGGGSVLDLTKAVSIMLTNSGASEDYQGWDLVKQKPVPKIGIPTIFGSGAEVSKAAVLTGKKKKLGINSSYSLFDGIVIDPLLAESAPLRMRLITAFDCYLHAFEALNGIFTNTIGKVLAESAIRLCESFFQNSHDNEPLSVASLLALEAAANGETGVVHALSYGLSFALGLKHPLANCLVLNKLGGIGFYDKYIKFFRGILDKYEISLSTNICSNVSDSKIEQMVNMALGMEKPLTNALGENWKTQLSPAAIKKIYLEI